MKLVLLTALFLCGQTVFAGEVPKRLCTGPLTLQTVGSSQKDALLIAQITLNLKAQHAKVSISDSLTGLFEYEYDAEAIKAEKRKSVALQMENGVFQERKIKVRKYILKEKGTVVGFIEVPVKDEVLRNNRVAYKANIITKGMIVMSGEEEYFHASCTAVE